MKSLILINPKAGLLRGCKDPEEVMAKLVGLKLNPEIVLAEDLEGIARFIQKVKADKPEVVLIAGGDGTTATVIKELIEEPVVFGFLPTGSTNNIGQSIGLLGDGLDDAIAAINGGYTTRMDLGRANGELFVESVGVGLLAQIMSRVGEQDSKKEVMKVVAHSIAEVVSVKPLPVSIWADGREEAGDTVWLTITNTGRAAAVVVDQTSNVTDKQLELVYAEPIALTELSRYVVAFIRNSHVREEKFHRLRAQKFHLTLPAKTEVHIDGRLTVCEHLEVEVVPSAIEVFVP